MTKQNLKRRLRAARIQLPKCVVRKKSLRIHRRLIRMPAYRVAQRVACYVSVNNEVDTKTLIRATLREGKRVGVPIARQDGVMDFQAIAGLKGLRTAHYGLREPVPNPNAILPPHTIDSILIPGIAFDRYGHRIGSGKGYYDRFLTRTKAVRIGLAYAFQIIDRVPAEPHDVKMDFIVTESEIIEI